MIVFKRGAKLRLYFKYLYFCICQTNNPLENTDFDSIRRLFGKPARILVTAHTNPDGDAIGSGLALSFYLRKKGHDVAIMVPDLFPDFLAWMPGASDILVFSRDRGSCLQKIAEAEIIIAADFNQLNRLGPACEFIEQSQAIRVLIDHHLFPSDEFHHKISVTRTSSTSELVYTIIESSGDLALIDKEIAECIYAGIITDTGSLSYACNYVNTYLVVAELFRRGIDGERLHRLIYDTYSEQRLRLLGYSISDQLVVMPEFHTAYIHLSKKDLEKFDYQIGDTEGIVNYALSIKGINLAALFMERDGIVKASFRSKGDFSVSDLARQCFNGGGHRNAAGANCYDALEYTIEKFKSLLPLYQQQLKQIAL
jgi:phosphoesterase RecJ-like protein